jgi:hypothetical protein
MKQTNNYKRPADCCGLHEFCEREMLQTEEVEYYDDEELDRFKGKNPSDYTESETAEFGEVLYTMLESDVSGWLHSLALREIALPDALKDEVLLIVSEKQ